MPRVVYTHAQDPSPAAILLCLFSLMLVGAAVWFGGLPLDVITKEAREVVDNPLMQLVYTGRTDELGQLQLALKMCRSQLRAVVGRVLDASHLAECVTA